MKELQSYHKTAFLLVLIFCFCRMAQAQEIQESPVLYRVITTDGNEYIGEILEENEDFILLRTERLGEITISKKDIKSMKQLDAIKQVGGEIWLDNPQSTRYFWAPNGYGLKKGEGYYQNVWVLFNQVSYGLTDNFSIGGGMFPGFLFGGGEGVTPIWITPKFSIPIVENKFNLGIGALAVTALGTESGAIGIVYGSGTLGSRDRNASIGMGFGYGGGEISSIPTFSFSGMYRTGRNGYLLAESYFLSPGEDTFGIIMLGGRRIIRRIGIDFGGVIPYAPDADGVYILPWLGLSLPFGQ